MNDSEDSRAVRQQIYDRIRQSSHDEYILDEMIRLGFWSSGKDAPSVPEQLIRKEAELSRELRDLLKKQRRFENRKKMLKEMRTKRLAESRKKQQETKERKKRERDEKARQWQQKKATAIFYLGEGVSAGLNQKELLTERLNQYNLPVFTSVEALAQAMEISVGELRFLTFHRKVSKTTHYQRFYMPKKSGGVRLISAPMPRLKHAQYWVFHNILQQIPLHSAGHGFRPAHSIVSNAEPHQGQDIVINMDLRDFFPSISYKRIKGLFHALGYSEQIATILGLLCTEPEIDQVELDGETYYVANSERHLPQGAPTSPALTSILCRRLDSRLQGMADKLGFAYTRYADDLTFSASGETARQFTQLLWQARKIIEDEGFVLHPEKLRIMRKGSRQEVTGIVVNEKLSVNRKTLKNFRALLFHIEKDGLDGKHWKGQPVSLAFLKGFANYVKMVDPDKGRPLLDRINKLIV